MLCKTITITLVIYFKNLKVGGKCVLINLKAETVGISTVTLSHHNIIEWDKNWVESEQCTEILTLVLSIQLMGGSGSKSDAILSAINLPNRASVGKKYFTVWKSSLELSCLM